MLYFCGDPKLNLIHRYEMRLHHMYQRGIKNLILLRTPGPLNDMPESPEFNAEPNETSMSGGRPPQEMEMCESQKRTGGGGRYG